MQNPISWLYTNLYLRFNQEKIFTQVKLDAVRHQQNQPRYKLDQNVEALAQEVINDLDFGKRLGRVWFEDSKKAYITKLILDFDRAQKLTAEMNDIKSTLGNNYQRQVAWARRGEKYEGPLEFTADGLKRLNLETTHKLANIWLDLTKVVDFVKNEHTIR
jgi:hypothetical protein